MLAHLPKVGSVMSNMVMNFLMEICKARVDMLTLIYNSPDDGMSPSHQSLELESPQRGGTLCY